MPEYEFLCRDCGARKDILAPYAVAAELELVCVTCGGTMAKDITRSFSVSIRGDGNGRGPEREGRLAHGHDHHHHHHDSHGAVRLTRPNPFSSDISHGGEG